MTGQQCGNESCLCCAHSPGEARTQICHSLGEFARLRDTCARWPGPRPEGSCPHCSSPRSNPWRRRPERLDTALGQRSAVTLERFFNFRSPAARRGFLWRWGLGGAASAAAGVLCAFAVPSTFTSQPSLLPWSFAFVLTRFWRDERHSKHG